jgi:ubiquinone/menaquinone biosynthesis C-methylase UbiE
MTDNTWTDTGRFDSKASEWDASAMRALLADAVSRAIIAHMPVKRPQNALEFGCGTGLVTTRVAPHCAALTAVDTSQEMLKMLRGKIEEAGIANVSTAVIDLTRPDEATGLPAVFDFVFSSMTLHHIPDTAHFLRQLNDRMEPGGTLSIADLDAEDGFFHDDETEQVHHGFDRITLQGMLEAAGFACVAFMTAHVIEKKNRAGEMAAYPVFLATAVKPQA